ncbi:MAG: hypothetical protein ACYC2P_13465 [Paludibacteraceae bacterium]
MASPAKKSLDLQPAMTMPFVVNQLPMHNHSVQIINKKTYNFTDDQAINLDRHITDVIINPQTSVSSAFFTSNGNFITFKIQADRYAVRRSFIEFDITNTSAASVTLAPAPFLVDFIRYRTGSGAMIQEIRGEDLWHDMAATYNTDRLTGLASSYNISPSTFGSNGTLAAGASVTVSIPLISSFIDQLHFFMGALNQTGLELQVYARGPDCMEVGLPSALSLTATRLRFTVEQYSGKATDSKIEDMRRVVHDWKFLNSVTQRHTISMTAGNKYSPQLQSLNGLVPFAWFGLRASTSGVGLYNFTPITDYELLDEQNRTLQNGVRISDAIARFEQAPDNFDSKLYTTVPIIPLIHIERPMVLLSHPVCTGFQFYNNNFLSITAGSTGTYNLDIYAKRWTVLQLSPDGVLSVDN